MARIPIVTRDRVAENEQPAYDAFMASRCQGRAIGHAARSCLDRRMAFPDCPREAAQIVATCALLESHVTLRVKSQVLLAL